MVSLEAYGILFILNIISHQLLSMGETHDPKGHTIPMVINTWKFTNSTQRAWDLLANERKSSLDAIEQGCSVCEREQCDHTVGWGGSPDESGETTLDAMIMDGPTHNVGAVGSLRRVKNVISVARKVLENTQHTLIVGDLATDFAIQMGFKEENLTSEWSKETYERWRINKCQPNYWNNVTPDPKNNCGPYRPKQVKASESMRPQMVSPENHDTIGMVAIDTKGRIAVGTSTNGMIHKIPGRVGDSPIPGAGAYVDQDYGGAAATGDGDIILRLLPSYQAVENLRQGMEPMVAAQEAIKRIAIKFPKAQVAIVVANVKGDYGAACMGIPSGFPFSVCNPSLDSVTVKTVPCII